MKSSGLLELVRNLVAHGDAREGKWRGNWRMEWVASTLHATSERGLSSITKADAHTSAASSRVNWRPHRFEWTCPFRGKTKSGFCACAITSRTSYTPSSLVGTVWPTVVTASHRNTSLPVAHALPLWEPHSSQTPYLLKRSVSGVEVYTVGVCWSPFRTHKCMVWWKCNAF